jgi:hypothetical protein
MTKKEIIDYLNKDVGKLFLVKSKEVKNGI